MTDSSSPSDRPPVPSRRLLLRDDFHAKGRDCCKTALATGQPPKGLGVPPPLPLPLSISMYVNYRGKEWPMTFLRIKAVQPWKCKSQTELFRIYNVSRDTLYQLFHIYRISPAICLPFFSTFLPSTFLFYVGIIGQTSRRLTDGKCLMLPMDCCSPHDTSVLRSLEILLTEIKEGWVLDST